MKPGFDSHSAIGTERRMDRSLGKVQLLNGCIYYSPNCNRSVQEPPHIAKGINIFLPSMGPAISNNMGLNILDYMQPQWWTREWGWISFMPHNPDYSHPPFHPLLQVPRRLLRLPDEMKYFMPPGLSYSWSQLENNISWVTALLQVYCDAPLIRPMYPWAFGYKKHFRNEGQAMKSIIKSKDWFSVWVALVSYLAAMAERMERSVALRSNEHLATRNWVAFLLKHGVERTWLDSFASSVGFCFDPGVQRSGVFLDLVATGCFQPSVEWFCSCNIPVWYRWQSREAEDTRFSHLAPLAHQLQLATTTLTRSLSPSNSQHVPITPLIDDRHGTELDISHPINLIPSWDSFFQSRNASHRILEQTESLSDKEKRLARERQPPRQSAKVFRWVKEVQSNAYIRELVPKKWRQDVLAEYSSHQSCYDPFFNEWDCCSQFGSGDEDVADGDGGEYRIEDELMHCDVLSDECFAEPTSFMRSTISINPLEYDEEWLPYTEQDQSNLSLDQYEEEVIETAQTYLGYVPPVLITWSPPLTELNKQKDFFRFLGLSWNDVAPLLFDRPRILALVEFTRCMQNENDNSSDLWDVKRSNRISIAYTSRFQFMQEIAGSSSPLFVFDFGKQATVCWKLLLTNAADALLVCRLHPQLDEKNVALFLVRRGIPFYTIQKLDSLPVFCSSTSMRCDWQPFRPAEYNFTLTDYCAYSEQCELFLQQPRSRAALLRGGYIWRVAMSFNSFEGAVLGPTGRYTNPEEMFVVTLPDGEKYADDALTQREVALLSGIYSCATGEGSQISHKSWCPPPSLYSQSGIDFGRWTPFNESLFAIGATDSKAPGATLQRQPCSSKKWRNICRGSRNLRQAMVELETASLNLIRETRWTAAI